KALRPVLDIVPIEMRDGFAICLYSRRQRHGQRLIDLLGDIGRISRIDTENPETLQLLRRAGIFAEHKHARIAWILDRKKFLGNEVLPVDQRGDKADVSAPQSAQKFLPRNALFAIDERAVLFAFKIVPDFGGHLPRVANGRLILLDIGAAERRDLGVLYAVPVFGVLFKKFMKADEAMRKALRIVETLGADKGLALGLQQRRALGVLPRRKGEVICLDADRENTETGAFPLMPDPFTAETL